MKRKTIRNHKDFLSQPDDIRASNGLFFVKARPAKIAGQGRYGIVAPKKVFKLAVSRNRAKRLVRDWIGNREHLMDDNLDYIFVLRDTILNTERSRGRKKMAYELINILQTYKNRAKKS